MFMFNMRVRFRLMSADFEKKRTINNPRRDERLSWPSCLTRFETYIRRVYF